MGTRGDRLLLDVDGGERQVAIPADYIADGHLTQATRRPSTRTTRASPATPPSCSATMPCSPSSATRRSHEDVTSTASTSCAVSESTTTGLKDLDGPEPLDALVAALRALPRQDRRHRPPHHPTAHRRDRPACEPRTRPRITGIRGLRDRCHRRCGPRRRQLATAYLSALAFGAHHFDGTFDESFQALVQLPQNMGDPRHAWRKAVAAQLPGPIFSGGPPSRWSCSPSPSAFG